MDLKSLQHLLHKDIITQNETPTESLKHISSGPISDAENRFLFYQNGYPLRLGEALADDFSVSLKLMREKDYEKLFAHFMSEVGSQTFTLNQTGEFWLSFLKTQTLVKLDPLIIEMSEFEWDFIKAELNSYHPEKSPLIFMLGDSKIQIHPSLILKKSNYPLPRIFSDEEAHPERKSPIAIFYFEDIVQAQTLDKNIFDVIEHIVTHQNMDLLTEWLGTKDLSSEKQQSLVQEAFEFCFSHGIFSVVA